MQSIPKAIVLAAGVSSATAFAAPPAAKHVATTRELVELCGVSADDPAYTAAFGFCLGYIDAALDYHAALTRGKKFAPIVCPDVAVTREEVVTVFLEWSRAHPRDADTGVPVESVMRAVYEKWPCSGQ